MPSTLEIQKADDESSISAADTSSTCAPDDISEDLEWKDSQYKKDKKTKGRKLPVTGWKGPLKYRYLNDDGCLDGDDPWPVPKTTQHKGPLVKMVCGSLKVKFVDVVDDISARDAARMRAMLGREHIVSL